ncbi:MAG: zf-HC2 domain-containing protein [Bdellovibrio sp.]|nr:zf-HC2 domain-containing protein [Bdellovibrio sp.]
MWIEDLKTYSKIGRVFWPTEPGREIQSLDRATDLALETLTATTLLKLNPERTLEKASHALLERAKGISPGNVGSVAQMNQTFFRLSPEARLVLVGLHVGKWSYARISRITQLSTNEVEKLAWRSRIELGVSLDAPAYPAGATQGDPSCPEYQKEAPWTQRFLDEELSGRERVFIQSHLLACPSCAQAVARCRQLYYHVERSLNSILDKLEDASGGDQIQLFSRALQESPALQYPSELTFLQSLRIFFRNPDMFWLAIGVGVFILFSLVRFWRGGS